MKKKITLLSVLIILFLQLTYSQNHPQLKLWSLPSAYYNFQNPSSPFTSLPTNTGTNGYTGYAATKVHNIMYSTNNMTLLNGNPYKAENSLRFFTVDNHLYNSDGSYITSLTPKGSTTGVCGENCIVPIYNQANQNQTNQYYVITSNYYAKIDLCNNQNQILDSRSLDSRMQGLYSGESNLVHCFLSTSKEIMITYQGNLINTHSRYLFRFVKPQNSVSHLDVFLIKEDINNINDITYLTSLNENTYFLVGNGTNGPLSFEYISEMEIINTEMQYEGNTLSFFRLALPFRTWSNMVDPNYTSTFPGLKLFDFIPVNNSNGEVTGINIINHQAYIFHSLNPNYEPNNDVYKNDELFNQKINGLEFSPNGRFLFFNFSCQHFGESSPYCNTNLAHLVYIDLGNYNSLPTPTALSTTNPNPIPLHMMPVPTSNYHSKYSRSFIEWGYDNKLYYATVNYLLSVDFNNSTNYDPSTLPSQTTTPPSPWYELTQGCSYSYDDQYLNHLWGEGEEGDGYEHISARVIILPDQIDGEYYDDNLGCCMTIPNFPASINKCVNEDFDVTQYITDWSFETGKYDYGDGTVITNLGTNQPAPHRYHQAGDYAVTITLYWPCGSQTVTTFIHVTCCQNYFNFSDVTICLEDYYTANFQWSNPYNQIYPFTSTEDFGDGNSVTTTQPSITFQNISHQYSQPGIYHVSITLIWGSGCSLTITHTVTVRVGGSIPDLSIPNNTTCIGSCPCYSRWEGPSTMLIGTNFNADNYDLQIWDYNDPYDYSHIYDSKMAVAPPSTSFTNGDIFEIFPSNINCRHFHYKLELSNCFEMKQFTGDIYVKGCVCENNVCIEHCCTKGFVFSDITICVGDNYFPDFQWVSSSDPIFPFTYSINFGDGNSISTSQPDINFYSISHQYSQAGIYNVSITIDWGNGCIQTITRQVTVTGGLIPTNLILPKYATSCIQDNSTSPITCKTRWEGPSVPIGNFNAIYYDLTLWDDNNILYDYKQSPYLTPPASYGNGDIFEEFPSDIICRHFHYNLVLADCYEARLFQDEINVNGCFYNGTTCVPYTCEAYHIMMLSPDNINNSNIIENNIIIYPNPTKDELFIKMKRANNQSLDYDVKVQNILSETLQDIKSIKQDLFTLDLSKYCNGTYLIKIITNNKSFIYKVIKE